MAGASTSERDIYNIKKFDGSNFTLWKAQIKDVLIQKKQIKALRPREEDEFTDAEWNELDELASSTIRLHLAESVYFTVMSTNTTTALWTKLCDTYEKETASNKVYLMKRLFNLHMKESTSVSVHLNEFNNLFSQLVAQNLNFGDEVKAIFLLCSLPASWDTFCTAISNSTPQGVLRHDDVASSLLAEEIRRKSMDTKTGGAYSVQSRGRSRTRDQSQQRSKSRSKSRGRKDIVCYHCHKPGHIKKDCYAWKREQKKKKNADKNEVENKDAETKPDVKGKAKLGDLDYVEAVEEVKHDMPVTDVHDLPDPCEVQADILFASSTLSFDALVANDGAYGQDWMLDSGASYHVTPHREWFSTYKQGNYGSVRLGDSYTCDIVGIGDICCEFPNGSSFVLKHVRHVPELTKSLISTGQLDDLGFQTNFGNQRWKILKGSLIIAKGVKCGSLYPMHVSSVHDNIVAITEQPSTSLWHRRLGHMSKAGMQTLTKFGYVPELPYSDFEFCEFCVYGKHAKSTHQSVDKKPFQPLELVHSDVCGPMPTKSLGGGQYFITFIDDATRKVWVYIMAGKDDALSMFQKFLTLVEKQSGKKLKCLRTDNGGEYVSNEFKSFCESKGIRRELTAPYTPAQNGVAERMNRTIQEKVTSMLTNAGLSETFWAEAVNTAVHLINRSPSKPLDLQIPEQAWSHKKPTYEHLRVFGCEAYMHVPKELRKKLDPKSKKCIFLGYGVSGEMGYRLWDPEARKLVRSSHVIFNEKVMHKKPVKEVEYRRVTFEDTVTPKSIVIPQVVRGDATPDVDDGQRVQDEPSTSSQPLRRSTRVSVPPERFVPGLDYVMLTDCGEPSCYREAMQASDKQKWEYAMKSEYDSIMANQTWDLVTLPNEKKVLPCKWIFKQKDIGDGQPKYKARLVAKGFVQEKGIDFDEIFSPVVKMTTLRTVLALVAKLDMDLVQMDVKTAFLHGDLHDEIYMQQPEGFAVKGKENLVCRLKKSLYGLKQAPRQWYQKFDTFMQSQNYRRSQEDPCLYTRRMTDGSLVILVLYVDDMLIAGTNTHEIIMLKKKLSDTFSMKDLGDAKHILGMRIKRDRSQRLLYLSQAEYVRKVLHRFHMEKGKVLSTPLPPYVKLSKNDSPKSDEDKASMAKVPYCSAVGSLMYAMVATRPDIAFAVGVVSRFMANPGRKHWEAVKGILRYLSGTADKCLRFGDGDASIVGYTDADYAGNLDNRRSTSGYVFTFAGGAISWRSCLQDCTSSSTTEAEYVAASDASKEAIWLARLVGDLDISGQIPVLHCDSQSAIALARNPVFHAKTKHIDVRFHFIRDVLADKRIELAKVHTDDNPADALTKSLTMERFTQCRQLMGIE